MAELDDEALGAGIALEQAMTRAALEQSMTCAALIRRRPA